MKALARLFALFLEDLEQYRRQCALKKRQAALEDARDWLSFYRRGVITYERLLRECAEDLVAETARQRCVALPDDTPDVRARLSEGQ